MEDRAGEWFFALIAYLVTPAAKRKRDKHFKKARKAFGRAIDRGVHPLIHRVASSKHYSDRLIDVKREWTCRDLAHALLWLDAITEASEVEKPDIPD